MQENNNKKLYFFMSFLLLLITIIIFSYFYNTRNENITYLNENWELTINNNLISNNFNVTKDKFETLKKGDIIELKNTIPNIDYLDDTLEIYLTYTSIELFLENELIYQSGLNEINNDTMLCDGLKWINLPNDISNKNLYIKMIVGEDNAISCIKDIKISNRATITNYFIKDKILSILFGSFLLIFGLFLLSLFALSLTKEIFDEKIFYLCFYCLCIGFWLLTKENILTLILGDDITIKYIEYITLYLAPISVLGFISNIKDDKNNCLLFNKYLIRFGFILFGILTTSTFILQLLNIIHFKQTLIYFQISIISISICLFINIILDIKKKLFYDKTIIWGIIIMFFSICLDVIIFNLNTFNNHFINFYSSNTTIFGIMILLFALAKTYYKTIMNLIIQNSREEMLEKLAFSDILTGLNNRTWYEQYIANPQKEYTMISMDLNNLKQTNDNLGHNQGDELIKRFANILQNTFSIDAHTIRFGGDEFLVILEHINREKVSNTIKEMNKMISLINKKYNDEIDISVSYGIAYSNEKEKSNPNDIYKLADKRMYKMKKMMKN